jgi:hypothetical protein
MTPPGHPRLKAGVGPFSARTTRAREGMEPVDRLSLISSSV